MIRFMAFAKVLYFKSRVRLLAAHYLALAGLIGLSFLIPINATDTATEPKGVIALPVFLYGGKLGWLLVALFACLTATWLIVIVARVHYSSFTARLAVLIGCAGSVWSCTLLATSSSVEYAGFYFGACLATFFAILWPSNMTSLRLKVLSQLGGVRRLPNLKAAALFGVTGLSVLGWATPLSSYEAIYGDYFSAVLVWKSIELINPVAIAFACVGSAGMLLLYFMTRVPIWTSLGFGITLQALAAIIQASVSAPDPVTMYFWLHLLSLNIWTAIMGSLAWKIVGRKT